MQLLLTLELTTSLLLTGLIWTVQIVHYPSFIFVDLQRYRALHEFHQRRISFMVIPLMILELLSTILLTVAQAPGAWIRLLLTVLIWLSTFFLSVPLHERLLKSHNQEDVQRLVITNWPRTLLWTLKSILILMMNNV